MSNQKYDFQNLTKTVVAKMLSDKKSSLIDVPKEHVKSSTVDVILHPTNTFYTLILPSGVQTDPSENAAIIITKMNFFCCN